MTGVESASSDVGGYSHGENPGWVWAPQSGAQTPKMVFFFPFSALGNAAMALPSARRIVLTTNAKNERAIRCYLACGFVAEGRPRKVLWIEGEYVDLVEMSILRNERPATTQHHASAG